MAIADMRELGSSGLRKQGGVVYEEYLTELSGSRWFKVVREMQDHPIVGAMLYLLEMQIRQVTWTVKPADESKTARKWATFTNDCFHDMSFTWADTMSEVVSMFSYGHAVLELVYKLRGGETSKPETDSRYDDGLIGWRKWTIRAQDTFEWQFDAHGGVQGIVQSDPYATPSIQNVPIPIEKLLLFRTSSTRNNPNGRSFLRTAYRSYYFAKHLANVQAIFYERLNGVPHGKVPSQLLSATATTAQKAILTNMQEILANLRIDEQAALITPSDRDEHGNPYYEVTLLRADASAGYDIEATIIRNHQEILMSLLADVIMLGHDSTGSNALSVTKMDMFWTGVNALVAGIADVINGHAIRKLMKLNKVPVRLWPTAVPGSVERVDLDQLGQYLVRMAGSGIVLDDPDLQKYLLRQANMPISAALEAGKVSQRTQPTQAESSMADAGRSSREATKQQNTQGEGN
ncbi:MAG: hypothetical protein DDT21_01853 [Syntrophomonadaceae bacterium]|nr:hypothetical protein [Bacillota bacterium]